MLNNIKARSTITIIVTVAIVSLFLRITIKRILKVTISGNESSALVNLRLISTALENYAKDHFASYPANLSALVKTSPSYLDEDYVSGSPVKGYIYSCPRLETGGYTCSAAPLKCRVTGKIIYTVTTGGLLVSDDCSKKE